jgi:hypothetical protein
VRLGNLKAGAVRELSREELSDLHRQVDEHR